MENKISMKTKLSKLLLGFAFLLTAIGFSVITRPVNAYACTGKCPDCGGDGYVRSPEEEYHQTIACSLGTKAVNYFGTTTMVEYYTLSGCTSCGGSGVKYIAHTSTKTATWDGYSSGTGIATSCAPTLNNSITYHKGEADYIKSAATCTNNAVYYYSCSRSGCKIVDKTRSGEYEGSKLGHSYSTSWTTDSAGTTRYKKCTRTGCTGKTDTQYKLTLTAGSNVSSVTGAGWYNSGTKVIYAATAKTGYHFGSSNNTTTSQKEVTMTGPKSITTDAAVANTYKLTLAWNGATHFKNNGTWGATFPTTEYPGYLTYDATIKGIYGPGTIARTGYVFDGWWNGNFQLWDNNGDAVKNIANVYGQAYWSKDGKYYFLGDTSATAHWIARKYKLTIDYNGATTIPSSVTEYENFLTYDSKIANVYNATQVKKVGYSFDGWWCGDVKLWNADGTPVKSATVNGSAWSDSSGNYKWAGNTGVKAKWTPNTYIIYFYKNLPTDDMTSKYSGSGSTSNISAKYDKEVTLPECGFTIPGYTFAGWSYDGKIYQPGDKVKNLTATNNGAVTIAATWNKNMVSLTFDANGGTLTGDSTVTGEYGSQANITSTGAKKDGYVFAGWSTTKNDANTLISSARYGFSYVTLLNGETKYFSEVAKNNTLYAFYTLPTSDVKNLTLYIFDPSDSTNEKKAKTVNIPFSRIGNTGTYNIQTSVALNMYFSSLTYNSATLSLAATDNAGNNNILWDKNGAPDPAPNYYKATTIHKKYNPNTGLYEEFYRETAVNILEGSRYAPKYLSSTPVVGSASIPTGYFAKSIDSSRIMNQNETFYAYYNPYQYTITYEVKSPVECSVSSQSFYADEIIKDMPSASAEGYTIGGWVLKDNTDYEVRNGDKYSFGRNITVIPKSMTKNSYPVIYDAVTNGGSTSATTTMVEYQSALNYSSPTATKSGYRFVGWNTDPSKHVAGDGAGVLKNGLMPAGQVTLYAIFEKTVSYNFIQYTYDANANTYNPTTITGKATFYNTNTSVTIAAPVINEINNWVSRGWAIDNNAYANVVVVSGGKIAISNNTTFYAVYEKGVTLSYNPANNTSIDDVTGYAYLNAAGNEKKFEVTIHDALSAEDKSFVSWVQTSPDSKCTKCKNISESSLNATEDDTENGCPCHCFYAKQGYANTREPSCTCCYAANEKFYIDEDTVLTARWDYKPKIIAFDKYVSSNDIATLESFLLNDVNSYDNEDVHPPVEVYNLSEVKNIVESCNLTLNVSIIYKTTDSYGNTAYTKSTLHVANTTAQEIETTSYARYISSRTVLATYDLGGLEDASLWKTNAVYQSTLSKALYNMDLVKNKKLTTSNSYTFEDGSELIPQYVINLSESDIHDIKSYMANNGSGKFQSETSENPLSAIISEYLY